MPAIIGPISRPAGNPTVLQMYPMSAESAASAAH
jgi:hypothetical protein